MTKDQADFHALADPEVVILLKALLKSVRVEWKPFVRRNVVATGRFSTEPISPRRYAPPRSRS